MQSPPCRHAVALARIQAIITAHAAEHSPPGLTAREEAILAHWPRYATSAAEVVAALWPLGAPPSDATSVALRAALAPPTGVGLRVPHTTSVGAQLRELARRSPRVQSQRHPARGVKLWWVLESTDGDLV